ncbi:MAG: FAD-dependent oxidoreductase, partial [Bacteroidota bacterium]
AIKKLFEAGERSPAKPLAISNVSFLPKKQVIDHMLMIGDAAGMIPPLAGNGMAMAIHGAKLAAECSLDFLLDQIDRKSLDTKYQKLWTKQFGHRLYWGRKLHRFMGKPYVSETAVQSLRVLPFLLRPIIRQTHGRPIQISG